MKLLVTGANGQLGSELRYLLDPRVPRLREDGDDKVVFVDRDELDITDADAVNAFFEAHKPDYCINAAAYTNVEKAEDEYEAAHAVNAVGAENLARACTKNNTTLFHISTDFVFDGKKTVPYTEDDEPNPRGVYARTKYEGELAVQEYCSKSFIVRTAWLYSSFGSNFVKTIMRLCSERQSLPVVADQYGSPTYARDLAAALLKMIEWCEGTMKEIRSPEVNVYEHGDNLGLREMRGERISKPIPYGIYHYANDGEVTWFEFAQKIRDLAGLSCDLTPILTSEYPTKAVRPVYSVLSTKKIQHTFGVVVPEWDESLRECITLFD